MYQYNPTTPKEAVQEYIRQNKRKKAILLLCAPPVMILLSYAALPLIGLYGALPGSPDVLDEIGYGVVVIYYAAIALGLLASIAWIPCAIVGILLLLSSRAQK